MSLAQAVPAIMVGKRREYSAIRRCAEAADLYPMREFRPERLQPPELTLNGGQLDQSEVVRVLAQNIVCPGGHPSTSGTTSRGKPNSRM